MLNTLTKLITGTVLSIMIACIPLSAFAAVSSDAQSAAQAGINYLAANQNSDGSISGFGGETEWSVISIEASGQKASAFNNKGTSALDFLKTDPLASDASATTIEKKIIAIAATGENTASFGGTDYNSRLSAFHIDGQIGDTTLLNDDIFGVIAIDAAGSSNLLTAAQDALNYILAHQAADGGFSYTLDSCAWCGSDSNDTAAALVAIYAAEHLGLVNSNLASSKNSALAYLLSTQNDDGGFGYDGFSPSDGSSTAWGLVALNSIGGSVASEAALASNWLLQNQNPDGGFSYGAFGYTSSDTYTTAHASLALLGSTWLLRPTPFGLVKPQAPSQIGSSGGSTTTATHNLVATASRQTGDTGLTNVSSSVNNDDTQPAPEVLSATDSAQTSPAADKAEAAQNTKNSRNYMPYSVGLLGLVALAWFVLESLKVRKVS